MKITVIYKIESGNLSITHTASADVSPEEAIHCETLPDRLWAMAKKKAEEKE